MKSTEIRANFNISRNEWQLFKAMSAKFKAFTPQGNSVQANSSSVLRELIFDWIHEHQDVLKDMTEELKKYESDGED
jgi:hypothetical protein